jgi:hypothetical protein
MSQDAKQPGLVGRLIDAVRPPVAELIGRYVLGSAQTTLYKSRSYVRTTDETRPDYEFWDKLRRCKAKGYTLSGLFCKRIENIFASWTLGQGVEITLSEGADSDDENNPRNLTDTAIADFLEENADTLLEVFRDHLGLGDQWIIVNADGSLSIPSPDTVEPEWAELDYRQLEAVTVTTKTSEQTIEDRYTAFERTVTVKQGGQVVEETTFENLIGRIPVVHVPHARSANETYGHPIHEELRPLYDQYDDLIFKQLDGAKLLGNPIPTFEGMEDISQVLDQNAPAEYNEYTDKDGNTVTHTQLTLDQNSVVFVGKGGSFKFAGPTVGFTEDTKAGLKSLFLLLLDHTGIPEFIWGGEMSSARASTETQLDQWVRDVKGRQVDNAGWLRDLTEIWLAMAALTDARLVIDVLVVTWPEIVPEDVRTLLDKLTFAKDRNLITDKTTLALLDIVSNPEQEAQQAQEEADERREALFPDGDAFGFQQDLNQAEEDDDA